MNTITVSKIKQLCGHPQSDDDLIRLVTEYKEMHDAIKSENAPIEESLRAYKMLLELCGNPSSVDSLLTKVIALKAAYDALKWLRENASEVTRMPMNEGIELWDVWKIGGGLETILGTGDTPLAAIQNAMENNNGQANAD